MKERKHGYVPNEHLPNPPRHGTTHPLLRIPQQHIEVGVSGGQATTVLHAPLEPHYHWGADQRSEKGFGIHRVQRTPAPCLHMSIPANQRGVRTEESEPCSTRQRAGGWQICGDTRKTTYAA